MVILNFRGTRGDLQPNIALGLELAKLGHNVSVYVEFFTPMCALTVVVVVVTLRKSTAL